VGGNGCVYYASTPIITGVTYNWSEDGSSSSGTNTYGPIYPPITTTVSLKEVNSCGTSPVKTITQTLNLPKGCAQ
jgi:hypothetical protein